MVSLLIRHPVKPRYAPLNVQGVNVAIMWQRVSLLVSKCVCIYICVFLTEIRGDSMKVFLNIDSDYWYQIFP